MDIKEKIQLGEFQSTNSINVDNNIKLELNSNVALNTEYNLKKIVDVTQIFDDERQASQTYRIYGQLQILSLLNNLRLDYREREDFFLPPLTSLGGIPRKNLINSFRLYLVRPADTYPSLGTNGGFENFQEQFEVLATPSDFDITKAGFSKNIFDEQQYSFILTKDIDITDMVDGFGLPITELFLYVEYFPTPNGLGDQEEMEYTEYTNNGVTKSPTLFTPIPRPLLNVGDIIDGGVLRFSKEDYQITRLYNQEYYIETEYKIFFENGDPPKDDEIEWIYEPFIPIKIKYFENEIRVENTGNTSYQTTNSIPNYALDLDSDGNKIWRNILDNGFIDPIDNIGVSFPFINGKHYVFQNIVCPIKPTGSNGEFSEIRFPNSELITNIPSGDVNNIGKICD